MQEALWELLYRSFYNVVKLLLDKGVDINKHLALHFIVIGGHDNVVELLL